MAPIAENEENSKMGADGSNSTSIPQAPSQLLNFTELPKSSLKWQDGKPFIIHRRQVHKAKELTIEGSKYYEVKNMGVRWLIRISA